MRLRSISAQAFRGIRDRIDVVLDGDAVLVCGENGSGKTSLAEAFEWVLYGTIARKTRSPSPSEYRGWRWIRSVHAADEIPTSAEIQLVEDDGTVRVITRSLDGGGERLELDGDAVTDLSALGPTVAAPRPILAQCEIQSMIQSEQVERWRELSALLGFGGFSQLRSRLQAMVNETDRHPGVLAARTTAARVVQPLTPSGTDPLSLDPDGLRERAARFLGMDVDASWEVIGERAETEVAEIHRAYPRPAALEHLTTKRSDVQGRVAELSTGVAAVVAEVIEHRTWHRENRHVAFIREGLDLIDPERPESCPFCSEDTLTAPVHARLEAGLRPTSERPSDHREDIRAIIREVLNAPGPLDVDVAAALIDAVPSAEPIARLRELVRSQSELDADRDQLSGLLEGFVATTERARSDPGDDASLRNLGQQLVNLGTSIATRSDALRAEADEVRIALEASLSQMTPERKARLSALQVGINLVDDIGSVGRAWRISRLQVALQGVIDALEAIEKREMAVALTSLSGDIARHYESLSPGHHIRVTGITVRDTRYRQAALGATSFGRPVNPVTTFSEAEGNCLGLSLFFCQRVERNPAWGLILLDDPVQSMDAGHEQALVRVLAELSRCRQVVVFTHHRSFADAFDAQFAPLDSYIRYDVRRQADPQPLFEPSAGRLAELLRFAEANAEGEQAVREACSGALRKAVERFIRDVAISAGEQPPRRSMTIEQRIDWLRDRGLVEPLDSGTLHRLRRFGSPGAHDDPTANATPGAILTNVATMRDLDARYLEQRITGLRLLEGGQRPGA